MKGQGFSYPEYVVRHQENVEIVTAPVETHNFLVARKSEFVIEDQLSRVVDYHELPCTQRNI
ncbi:hypothetical protein [Archaeoglobus sulfaticallidus]|nr:hypothetical protein [Archaeoglobus sulfaticallidus]